MARLLGAIGGQGQHSALAYLFLAKRLNFRPETIYVIDADRATQANPVTRALVSAAEDLGSKIVPLNPFPSLSGTANLNDFSGLFRTLSGLEERVLNLLFTEEQLSTPIERGMYGNPSVGASTFLTAIKGMAGARLRDFFNAVSALEAEPHRVVLLSSTLGGTGSGGAPALLQELASGVTNQGRSYNVQVTLITLLPWFQLREPNELNPDDPPVKDSDVQSNYHSNVEYLISRFKNEPKVRVIFLGPRSTWERPELPHRGNVNQPINPHYLHLIAADVARQCLTAKTEDFDSGIYGCCVSENVHPVIHQIGDWEARNLERGLLTTLDFFGLDSPKLPLFPGNKAIWETMSNIGAAGEGRSMGGAPLFLLPGNLNPETTDIGLQRLDERAQMKIFNVMEVSPQRLPTPFSHAFAFARKIKGRDPPDATEPEKEFIKREMEKAREDLLLLHKGFFYQILDDRSEIEWERLGLLGRVLSSWAPDLLHLRILTWRDIDIGACYPETFAFFSHRISQATKEALSKEIENFEKQNTQAQVEFWEWIGDPAETDPLWKGVLGAIRARRQK